MKDIKDWNKNLRRVIFFVTIFVLFFLDGLVLRRWGIFADRYTFSWLRAIGIGIFIELMILIVNILRLKWDEHYWQGIITSKKTILNNSAKRRAEVAGRLLRTVIIIIALLIYDVFH
ncbi:MAG: hypothetical protein P4L58_03135 [Candidatus Pacebacteria bacterium]|nr:hypothetical protein [Candidatus Paceibacterota bacterium]